jgi:hypothetical protein
LQKQNIKNPYVQKSEHFWGNLHNIFEKEIKI